MADLLIDDAPETAIDPRLVIHDGRLIWTDGDVSIVCAFRADKWSYKTVKNGVSSRQTDSKNSPVVDDTRRDHKMVKNLNDNTIDLAGILVEFGTYLMNAPDVMDSYMESITKPVEEEEVIDEKLVAQALDILQSGDPVKFIMDTFKTIHIGDDSYGRLLMLAIGSQHVRNTHGIHLTPSGASGKGKSHAGKTMLHMLPKQYWLAASLSPKSLYYYDLEPGTVIFSDDVILSEDLVSIIRRCITGFTESQEHITVSKDREATKLLMPPRIIWIIASVENFFDTQTRNRMIDIAVDESPGTDDLVFAKQVEDAKTGADEYPETDRVLVCREIYRIIKNLEPMPVVIPFADNINWMTKSNRRNFDVFKDLIKSFAVVRHLQRDSNADGALIATIDDYNDARELYLTKAEGEATKLIKGESDILRTLNDHGDCTISMLQKILKAPRQTIRERLKGRDGKGGLLEKVPGLTVVRRTDEIDDASRITQDWFSLSGYDILSNWSDVVSFKDDAAPHDDDTTQDDGGD